MQTPPTRWYQARKRYTTRNRRDLTSCGGMREGVSRVCTEERIRAHDGARCERVILALLRSRGLLSVRLLCFTHEPDWKLRDEEMKRGGTADATRDWQPHPEASQWCCQGNGHL